MEISSIHEKKPMQTMLHGLPVFVADIEDDDCGIKCISLVTSPAVESEFLAFAAVERDERWLTYSVADEEKRHVLGVVMRANYPIYRNDYGHEYWIMYRPEAIERMAERYLREGRSSDVNIQHVEGSDVEGVDMVQWFIKDSKKGIAPAAFDDIEDGSLFAEFHVINDAVWEKIKDGTFKGFSLEGIFSVSPSQAIPSEEKVSERAKSLTHNISYKDMTLKEKIQQAMRLLASVKMGSATTKEGVIFWDGDAELAVGDAVYIDSDGERQEAPDGDYTFEDGHVVTIAGGKVTAITEAPEAPVETPEEAPEVEAAEEKKEKCEDAPAEDIPDYAKDAAKIWESINDTKHRIDELRELVESIAAKVDSFSAAKPAHEEFKEAGKEAAVTGKFARIAELAKI